MLYKLGDYTKALEVLNTTAGSDSLVSIVSFYKGRIYQRTGLYQVALMEFFRSKMLNPSFAGYAISLGFQYLKSNQLDSAEVLLKSQLNVSQNLNAEIFAGLAEVERLQGERLQAINLYQKSLACDPAYMNNNFMLGTLLLEEKQYQSSILFLSRSLKYNREQENHHLYLGKAFYFLRQWDRALSGFLKIDGEIEKSQWIPKVCYVKSLIEYEKGNFHEATNLFRRAKEWNPDASLWMSEALQDLGQIYENEANYNDALGYYSQLIRINPSDSQSMLKLGTLYYQVGDIGEARIAFMNALHFERTATEAGRWLNQIDSVFE